MTEQGVIEYVKTQLGSRTVNVEITKKEYETLIQQAILKLKPYYNGVRYVQANGKVIDLSNHHPIAISRVWNAQNISYNQIQDFIFGGVGLMIWDVNFMQRMEMLSIYRALWNEISYQQGLDFRLVGDTLYLDGWEDNVLIEMMVNIKVVSDIEDESMYSSWFNEYVLALAKELIGRKRGKVTLEGSPIALDANTLLAEATAEKSNLESQLLGEIFVL